MEFNIKVTEKELKLLQECVKVNKQKVENELTADCTNIQYMKHYIAINEIENILKQVGGNKNANK